jgi:hypothetical protein
MRVRDYLPSDYDAVRRIHEATGIDYSLPDLSSPLFFVAKVLVDDEDCVRACGALYIQAECYLWLDPGDWASPSDKLAAIAGLDGITMHEAWLKGVEHAVLYLPPGMERFGKRLEELGFKPNRDGWVTYAKRVR